MKKFVNYVFIAAAAIAAAACAKDFGTETPETANVVVFTATLEQPTKADLTNYAVVWNEGDKIAVSNGTTWVESAALTAADITDGGRSATFSATIDAAASYTAVYPASAKSDAALPEGAPAGAIMLNLPSAQAIPAGKKIDPAALVQIATTDDPAKLTFKNATSLLEITIPEDGIESVAFEFMNASGSKFKTAGNAPVVSTPAATTGDEARVILSGAFTAGETYYATVFPQDGVLSMRLVFAKSGSGCKQLAPKTGTGAAEFALPVNGGWKVRNFGALSWFDGNIATKADLDLWASLSNYYDSSDVINLTADIDYGSDTWTPVNADATAGHFGGSIEGQNHSIYNIIINPTKSYSGFFGTVDSATPSRSIRDINFGMNPATNDYDGVSTLKASTDAVKRLGIVAGYLSNCDVVCVNNYIPLTDASTSASDVMFGAIAGRTGGLVNIIGCNNYGTMDCSATTTVAHYIGGFVGVFDGDGSLIDKCVNYGTVRKSKSAGGKGNTFIGGIVARSASGAKGLQIRGCVNNGWIGTTANVQAKQIYIGGILGMDNGSGSTTEPNITLMGCANEDQAIIDVTSLSKATNGVGVGGILGKGSGFSKLLNCYNYGTVRKSNNHNGITSMFGGIAGMVSAANVSLENCENGSEYNDTDGVVISTVETKSDSSTEYYGGIVGGMSAGSLISCSSFGSVSTLSTETGIVEIAGGVAGQFSGGSIENCVSKCTVSVAAPHTTCAAGGFIGLLDNTAAIETGAGCKVSGTFSCGCAANTGLMVGLSDNSAAATFGAALAPVTIGASQLNGNAIDSSNYNSYIWGGGAGANSITAVFE
ncbi:MAG: hypothetical protein J5640_07940 [Bacteroidales bacterium]|nr:hypothetical protein [Bacteroidales bacterium]